VNKRYLLITLFLLSIEILIALFIKDAFIRPFLGDVLVVMLIFAAIRIFYSGKKSNLAICVLLFSFLVEFSQYFELVDILGLEEYKIAQIVLGSTFDILDLVAYIVGVTTIYVLDNRILGDRESTF
jgi:hypothetical protein